MAIEWNDIGIIISSRPYGESDIIIHVLTQDHGSHYGLVKGGASRRRRAEFQIGNFISLKWKARIADNLGTYVCDLEHSFSANYLDDPLILLEISTLCSIADSVLPERECCEDIFKQAYHLLKNLNNTYWFANYIRWELNILTHLGFGLDLGRCAQSGSEKELIYVSPKSGRAVSKTSGLPYKDKLLKLPSFLINKKIIHPSVQDMIYGIDLTGYFFLRHIFDSNTAKIPESRNRLRLMMFDMIEKI